jgi:tripartite-type tricarboxylate transporter receptor subunit TctC
MNWSCVVCCWPRFLRACMRRLIQPSRCAWWCRFPQVEARIPLLASTTVVIIAPALYPEMPYKSPDDFASISLLAKDFFALVVHPSVPARSVKELIALAKARPSQLNYASSGPGDANHLAPELFQLQAGVKMFHVPYKGSAPGILSVLMGETDLMFSNIIPALPHIKSGKFRALGISSLHRSPILPGVATIAESGLPGYEVLPFYAVMAPAGVPREIVQRLNQEAVKAIQSPDMKSRFAAFGTEIVGSTPEALEREIRTEIAKWSKVIKQAGIKAPQ